jgi:hypothetical protein
VCGACGCPIKKKAKSLEETCPENMWNPVYYEEGMSGDFFISLEEVPALLQEPLREYTLKNTNENALFPSYDTWKAFLKELEKQL